MPMWAFPQGTPRFGTRSCERHMLQREPSTVNDDACGRDRRNRSDAGPDEQPRQGEEEDGKGSEDPSNVIQGVSGQLRADLRVQHNASDSEIHELQTPGITNGSKCLQFSEGSISGSEPPTKELFLRSDSNSVYLQKRGSELHEKFSQVPQATGVWEPVRVLSMDGRHKGRRVRENVQAPCFFGDVSKAKEHQEEVQSAIQKRIFKFRNRRSPSSTFAIKQSQPKDFKETTPVRSQLEWSRDQCSSVAANLHHLWPSGDHQVQGSCHDPTVGGSKQLQGQEAVRQEQDSNSICEPLSVKPGLRKRILGDLQKAIGHIEKNEPQSEGHLKELSSQDLHDLMHLRLIGEVFSPERFTSAADHFGLQAGSAFDLRLGQQLLCPKQRKECLDHIRRKKYGLVVVTPPCEMFSMLQLLGFGKSKETCAVDPIYQEKLRQAKILLNFAALVCHVQSSFGGSFLFEQPWNAMSWKEPCIVRLMNHANHVLVRTDQCMFGQADSDGNLMRKGTGFLTNNQHVAKALKKTCHNKHKHQPCLGSSHGVRRSTQAARYTGALITAVLRAYTKSCSPMTNQCAQSLLMSEIQWPQHSNGSIGTTHLTYVLSISDEQVEHLMSQDSENHGIRVDPTQVSLQIDDAANCEAYPVHALPEESLAVPQHPALTEEEDREIQQLSPAQRKALMTEIEKAHRGMGHPHQQRFLRILKLGRATTAALGLAKTFQCSQCKESTRPKPWRRSAPPRELSFNEVVGVDTVTIKHYDHNIRCLNIVCWGTRYQMIVPLRGAKAFDARIAYRQWVRTFGAPKFLKPDLGSEFLGDFL